MFFKFEGKLSISSGSHLRGGPFSDLTRNKCLVSLCCYSISAIRCYYHFRALLPSVSWIALLRGYQIDRHHKFRVAGISNWSNGISGSVDIVF